MSIEEIEVKRAEMARLLRATAAGGQRSTVERERIVRAIRSLDRRLDQKLNLLAYTAS